MHIVMAFDYEIKDLVHMKMEGLANVNIHAMASSKLSASKLKTQGHLNLRQPNALPQTGKLRNVYDDNFFDTLQVQSMESFLRNYNTARNETL
jgi:hypothetical protein